MENKLINMPNNKKILIIGLGLIGGSIAKALKQKLGFNNITALDTNEETISHALYDRVIKEGFTTVNDSMQKSDLVFLCTPTKLAKKYIGDIYTKLPPGSLVTDVCSTKTEIVKYADSIKSKWHEDSPASKYSSHLSPQKASMLNDTPAFIGGHPMVGSERGGYQVSTAHLFENAYYILTPTQSSGSKNVIFMTELVKGMGGIPLILKPEEHDFITAGISHVPHIIASALVNLVMQSETEDGKLKMLAAGGFKDITRIASSSPQMWENIISSNSEQIIKILSNYISILDNLKSDICQNNTHNIFEFFESAKSFRDSVPSAIKGLIEPLEEIYADVEDKPGIIGKIATLLGENGINIKNINISNNREFEQGCLKISLPDRSMADRAYKLLSIEGYIVYKK